MEAQHCLSTTRTPAAMKKEMLIKEHGLFQERVTLAVGEESQKHHHQKTLETYIGESGVGVVIIGSKSTVIKSGTFVQIPIHIPHQIKNTGTTPLVIISTKNSTDEDDFHTD